MVARNEVHLALECLLDLSQDFVGLRKLLRLVMCLIILVTIRSVSANQDHVKLNAIVFVPFHKSLCITFTQVDVSHKENLKQVTVNLFYCFLSKVFGMRLLHIF